MKSELPILQPENIKSCSRCRIKRVKCDMTLPACDRCKKKSEICDICDMVSYGFSTVRNLQEMLDDMQKKLTELNTEDRRNDDENKDARHSTFNKDVEEHLAVEVGTLTATNSDYIGTASGVAFSKIFLRQINVFNLMHQDKNLNNLDKLNPNISNLKVDSIPVVSLPRKEVTKYLYHIYIEHVQIFYLIVDVNHIANSIEKLYHRLGQVSVDDRYIIFMMLSISSGLAAEKQQYIEMHDVNTSKEYFLMAFKYFDDMISTVNHRTIRNVLLLIVWCLCLKNQDENENLWILTRHATSLCIQLGLHRNNPIWRLDSLELEMRNRLWWTCFILERQVALQTGRTLSIRNHAIDAELPRFTEAFDKINPNFGLSCPSYENLCFQPMYLLAKVRTIAGDILESVYIARGKNKTLAVESVYKSASRLREELDLWLESVMDLYIGQNDWVYGTLKLNYNIYSLVLSRPSPSFPNISISSSKVCLNDSKSFIDVVFEQINSNLLMDFWFISANILTVAITFLFASWILDAEFGATKDYIEKIQYIVKYLTKYSTSELLNVAIFNAAAVYTLEHLTDSENMNVLIQDALPIDETFSIDDDEQRKQFILDYLLNIVDAGPFYLVQNKD